MRRVSILSVSLGLLTSLGPVLRCSGFQAAQSQPPQGTLQIRGTPLLARSPESQTKVSDLDLLQKGYVVIGSVSVDWRLNASEISEPGIPAAALMAEAEQLMAEVASASQNPTPPAPVATATGSAGGWQQHRLKDRAEAGDAEAQYELGNRYLNGAGGAKDPVEAAKWFRKAAEQGNGPASYELGLMYREGAGVPRDGDQAVKWLRVACAAQLPAAQYELARMLDRASPRQWQELIGGASPKNPQDKQRLEKEQAQWEKDQREARAWYQAAAENGHPEAQFKLASRLEKEDKVEALKWLYLVNSYCRHHMETALCFDDFQPMFFQLQGQVTRQEMIEAQRRADNVRKK